MVALTYCCRVAWCIYACSKVLTAADKLFLVHTGQAAELKSLHERIKQTVIR